MSTDQSMRSMSQSAVGDAVFAGATVLVVDDHPPNLALLERILTNAGVGHVHLTQDPLTVVELCRTVRPDLVLLDLHMPNMDGVAVMEAIRGTVGEDEFMPVVVLTADSTPEARQRVLSAGANDFLTKPVDRIEVVLRARNLLHTRSLHGRLRAHNAQLRSEIAARNEAERRMHAERADKLQRVRTVLADHGPRMVFQRVAQLDTGHVVGFEALARFDHEPQRPPNVWFAEAAEVGIGVELELAAVRAALNQLSSVPAELFVSLNASPATALTSDLADLLAGLPERRVVLEITEHAQVDDYDDLTATLERLRRAGVSVAVDDAGAGFASLQHILRLRPDVIKLDITLVRDINRDPVKRALASSLVTFAGDIGSLITAEGIETPEELAALVDLGVPWGQGYYLGRPGPLPSANDELP